MKTPDLLNYTRDQWIIGSGDRAPIASAIDGTLVATTGSGGIDFAAMLAHARDVGGPALRRLTFHERARILKGLGLAILARKEELYELNYLSGATRKDGWIDIEGGAGTLFSFSSKGRRELPDAQVLMDGGIEPLSKEGSFVGQHIYTSLQGAALHINAFNFPVWGMLEKLAPTLLAGVPAIVKPASSTAGDLHQDPPVDLAHQLDVAFVDEQQIQGRPPRRQQHRQIRIASEGGQEIGSRLSQPDVGILLSAGPGNADVSKFPDWYASYDSVLVTLDAKGSKKPGEVILKGDLPHSQQSGG